MSVYRYGGYLLTGGKLDNGNPWQGVNILIAEFSETKPTPVSGLIAKARREDSILDILNKLRAGDLVDMDFDIRGKVTRITPHAGSGSPPTNKPMYAKEVK